MAGKYKISPLCRGTKFKDEYSEAQKRLTLKGDIVISAASSTESNS